MSLGRTSNIASPWLKKLISGREKEGGGRKRVRGVGGGGAQGRDRKRTRERLLGTFLFVIFFYYFLSLLTPRKWDMSLMWRGGGEKEGVEYGASRRRIDWGGYCRSFLDWSHDPLASPLLSLILCYGFLATSGTKRWVTASKGGAWPNKRRVGLVWGWGGGWGAPPEREQLFSRRSASHHCSFPVQARLPNYVLTLPHSFTLLLLHPPVFLAKPPAPTSHPTPWAAAAVGGTINSVWPPFSSPALFLPKWTSD